MKHIVSNVNLWTFQDLKGNPGWRQGQARDMSKYRPVSRKLPVITNNIKTNVNKMAPKSYPDIPPIVKSTARKLVLKFLSWRGVSLGDAIDLEQKFERFHNCLGFQLKIRDKFWSGFLIVVTKLIKSRLDCIEKVNIYRERWNLYQKGSEKIEKVKINWLFQSFNQLFWSFNWLFWSFN